MLWFGCSVQRFGGFVLDGFVDFMVWFANELRVRWFLLWCGLREVWMLVVLKSDMFVVIIRIFDGEGVVDVSSCDWCGFV